MTDKRQKATKVKCKLDESISKQAILWNVYLLQSSQDEAFEFCWSLFADEYKTTRTNVKLNKFAFGSL